MQANELARFLAGLPGEEPYGRLDGLRGSAAWHRYAATFTRSYAAFEARSAAPFSRWANAVSRPAWAERTVFYPFSGPDFLFAQLLHPTADTYILCGRERWEPLPALPGLNAQAVLASLTPLGKFVEHYLAEGFFVTQEMAASLDSHADIGVAHILLAFAARQGFAVSSIQTVGLDPQGRPGADAGHAASGFRIDLRRSGRDIRVFYFQQDLRNGFFSPASPLGQFIANAAPCLSFCKCASYLAHEPEFSTLTQFMLNISSVLVQDASGLPYRLLKDSDWNIALHGRYATPLQVFERYEQPELSVAYALAAVTTRKLDFLVGYGRDAQRAGLIVARAPEPAGAARDYRKPVATR